jgi:hypothetical protein
MGQSAISCTDRRQASPEARLHRLTRPTTTPVQRLTILPFNMLKAYIEGPFLDRTSTFRSPRKVDFHQFFAFIHLKCLPEHVFQRLFAAAGVVAGALALCCS